MLTKQLFPLVTEKSWQSLLIQDGKLLLINTRYKTEADFVTAYEKKSIFRKKKEIAVNDITRLAHPENKPKRLFITAQGKKVFIDFANQSELEEVTSYLREQQKLTPTTQGVGKFRAITPSLIGLGLTAVFTFVVYEDALTLEEGGSISTSGRNGLFKMLFAWLAEQLGPQNTLIAGVVLAVVCLFFMFKALQNPPNEVVYE